MLETIVDDQLQVKILGKLKLISENMENFQKKVGHLISVMVPTVELLSVLGHRNEHKRYPIRHICSHIEIFQEQAPANDPNPA